MADLAGLREPFRSNVAAMIAEAGGVTITSGYRSREQQIAARIRNGCPDIYTSSASSCRVPTARPGESWHEFGEAVDLGPDDAARERCARIMSRYGIHRPVRGEPWHFEPIRHTVNRDTAEPGPGGGAAPAPASSSGGDGIGDRLALLTSGSLWLRIAHLLIGAGLVWAGLLILSRDSIGTAARIYTAGKVPA